MAPSDTDDVIQDVFLRILQSSIAHRYDPDRGRFRSYLFQVTWSALASRTPRTPATRHLGHTTAQEVVDDWYAAWQSEALRCAVTLVEQSASASAQQILNLSVRGLRPSVIAETIGVSIDAVYKHRQRLRSSIQDEYHRLLNDE